MTAPEWDEIRASVKEIDRLVGADRSRGADWSALKRHLHFAMSNDLWDIIENDWPGVKGEIECALVPDGEPVAVKVKDLGEVAASGAQEE